MPINISQGSTIQIAVQFFSSAGITTVPTSATVTITYPPIATPLTTTSTDIAMSATNSTWTATWGSGVSGLGIVTYSISGAGQASPTTGTWRLVQP